MLYDFKSTLSDELYTESALLNEYRSQLKGLTDYDGFKLRARVHNKQTYYTAEQIVRGERTEHYLGKQDHPAVQAIQQRYFYEHAIANLENNLKEMERLAARYKTIEPNELRETFPKVYQFNAPEIFQQAGAVDARAWAKSAQQGDYCASKKHPEHLTQIAADGHPVRSKSEVIITNILFSYGLPLRHEEERIFGDMPIAPDFTVYSSKLHREIIWEHFGLMNMPHYQDLYQRKMAAFAAAGYYPYINLITTFDDADGNIDSHLIDKLVKQFFL